MATRMSVVPGGPYDVDPATYGTETAETSIEVSGQEAVDDASNEAKKKLDSHKAKGTLADLDPDERSQLYQQAYGVEGDFQKDTERAADAANEMDQEMAEPESLRRVLSNFTGPDGYEGENTEIAEVASELGLNQADVSTISIFPNTASNPEEAWTEAMNRDVQLSRLNNEQRQMVGEMVQQAIQENDRARELAEMTNIGNSIGLNVTLARKAARTLSRQGKL